MSSIAELVQSMNQGGSIESPPETPAAVETPAQPATPAVPATPQTPAAATPAATTPAQTPVVPQENKESSLTDPEWAARNKPATPETPASTETPATPASQATPASPALVDDTVFFGRVSEMTRGQIKSEKDFAGFMEKFNSLADQVQKGVQPKFESERAKLAYDILQKNPGQELDAAIRTATALKIAEKLPTMSDKDKLFNAFMLDPLNADLSLDDMKGVFDAQYEKRYGDAETRDILTKREHDIAVRQAAEAIQKVQSEFKVTQVEPERISQEVVSSVDKVVSSFGGVVLSFSDNPSDNELLNIPIMDDNELSQIKEDVLDPGKWHQNFLQQFELPNGGFNYEGYIQERWERENHKAIRMQAYEHGEKMGRLKYINEQRNATPPAEIADKGRPPINSQQSKTFFETWGEKVGVKL